MNPRRFALENLLGQCVVAYQLQARILELSEESSGERFHHGSGMGADIKKRRLRELKETEQKLDKTLERLVPAWEQFGAGEFVNATMTLMGEGGS